MRAHVSGLAARLAALPGFAPPADGWHKVLAARERRETRVSLRWPALAASFVLAVAAALAGGLQAAQEELSDGQAALDAPRPALAAEARAENERLEWILARLPQQNVMRGSSAFAVATLEDRLAALDDRLSAVALEPNAPERAERLWRERAEVMNTLVRVRYADAIEAY